VFTRKSAA
jgi:hypothetical protein